MEQNNALEISKMSKDDKLNRLLVGIFVLLLVLVVGFFLIYFVRPDWLKIFPKAVAPTPVTNQITETPNQTPNPTLYTVPLVTVTLPPTVTPPSPTPINRPGEYACDPIGICNHYIKTQGLDCPKTFSEPTCNNECSNESIRCKK